VEAVALVTDNILHNQLVQLVAEDHVTLTQVQAVAEAQAEQADMQIAHLITITGTFVQDTLHTLQLEMKEYQQVDKDNVQIAHHHKDVVVAMEVQVFMALAVAEVAEVIMDQELLETVEELAVTQ
jgi:hypothetical protein